MFYSSIQALFTNFTNIINSKLLVSTDRTCFHSPIILLEFIWQLRSNLNAQIFSLIIIILLCLSILFFSLRCFITIIGLIFLELILLWRLLITLLLLILILLNRILFFTLFEYTFWLNRVLWPFSVRINFANREKWRSWFRFNFYYHFKRHMLVQILLSMFVFKLKWYCNFNLIISVIVY